MDVLKVLSRGTRKTPHNRGVAALAGSPNSPAKLPSAGAKPHPQLFHDEVGRGQKRKRRNEVEVPAESDGDESNEAPLPEVDFFSNISSQATEDSKPKAEPVKPQQPVDCNDHHEAELATAVEPMDQDECRRLLKSHRLKVTVLSKPPQTAQETDKEKKKKTKKKKSKTLDEKGKAKQKKDDKRAAAVYPRPLTSFSELRSTYGISTRVAANLADEGYRVPTEVQMGAMPLLLRPETALGGGEVGGGGAGQSCRVGSETGLDLVAVAPTGSGKTVSFLVPAINAMMRRRARAAAGAGNGGAQHELEAVVVAPTRELAFQIVNEARKLVVGTALRAVLMKKGMRVMAERIGGASVEDKDEVDEESDEGDEVNSDFEDNGNEAAGPITKADILVTTPMPLVNHLTRYAAKALPSVRSLVLDEADVLLDPLFLDQTMGIWSACTNPELQATFWSATMPSSIETLITDKLAARSVAQNLPYRPVLRLVIGLKDTAVPNVTHKLIYAGSEAGKLLALRQLLRPRGGDSATVALRPPFLVFTQTVERATALATELAYDVPAEAGGASRVAALHAGLGESARSEAMRRFRRGDVWVLITTDVLARGVDFRGVNAVVNYDVPTTAAAYVHRAGRTGRAGREGGLAVTLYTKEDIPHVKLVANVIAASDGQAARGKDGGAGGGEGGAVAGWLLDALPDVSQSERKRLKQRGVESRRSGKGAKISTVSGYERRLENRRQGAVEASRRRKARPSSGAGGGESGDNDEWEGFDD